MNNNQVIAHMDSLKAKDIKYSMYGSRTGTDGTGDCSGVLYAALVSAGTAKSTYPPSTETLHAYLISHGYELHAENRAWVAKRGDIFIWGKKGQSAGAGGHTGIFIDGNNVIHCNYNRNGVTIDDHDIIWLNAGRMYFYVYRLKNNQAQQTPAKGFGKLKTYTLNTTVRLYTKPSTKAPMIAQLGKGDVVKFNDIVIAEGRLWACQPRDTGFGYIEIGTITAHGSVA